LFVVTAGAVTLQNRFDTLCVCRTTGNKRCLIFGKPIDLPEISRYHMIKLP